MATANSDDLRSFLQTRLQVLDPTLDVSEGSPADIQVITPTLNRFALDPLSTDVAKFFRDRVVQEYPDLATDNAGQLDDFLTKPFQLLFEPFQLEVQGVRNGLSVRNSSTMSEDEADALGANFFETRTEGEFAGGSVRLYFSAPTTSRVTTDKRCFTSSGLAYFPVQNYFITSQQMLFNRQGSFYFLDIVVQAEAAGDQYNIAKSEISGIEDVPGVIKVANLAEFTTGQPRQTNDEYLGGLEDGLTEKSLVTSRGVVARLPDIFEAIRALQIVGAGEEGMNRDIITGTGEGFLHLAGAATMYGNWLWVSSVVYRDDGPNNDIIPQAGDKIRFHSGNPAPSSTTVKEATVESILTASGGKYLLLLDTSLYGSSVITQGSFSLFKAGYITISNVPGGISSDFQVPDNTVHVGGHTDVFVRPNQDIELQAVLANTTDQEPLLAIVDLVVPAANTNRVQSPATDFPAAGTKPGDLLVIETGSGFAGTYPILEVEASPNQNFLRVDTIFSNATASGVVLRARVVRNITVDLVAPRIQKLPFTPGPVSDLRTTVGSAEFRFDSIDIQSFGATVGDVIEVLDGPDAGEFTIQSFSGSGTVFVDRTATTTGAGLRYQVYTSLQGIELPLVRVKSIEVLDSTNQTTGITVPYGDAVDIRTTCDLEGAGHELVTYDKQLIVFPDLSVFWGNGDTAVLTADAIASVDIDDTTDARYTQQLEIADGVVRTVTNNGANTITKSEVNVPPFMWNGKRDKLLAFTTKRDPDYSSEGDQTSDIANAKVGDSLNIYDGPNQGRYIIKDLRVLEIWGKSDAGHRNIAIVQVDPPLKVDPIRNGLDFIKTANGGSLPWTAAQLFGFLDYAADWNNASGFYTTFLTELRTRLNTAGLNFADVAALKTFFDPLIYTSYSVGPSAKGDLRMYFLEPASVELNFGEDPTKFTSAITGQKTLRLDPSLDPAQIFPEAVTATGPSQWNRNLGVRIPQTTDVFLTSGDALAKRGIRVGDVIEFYPAFDDIPSRDIMTSSWLCTTQLGSNVLQLMLPPSAQLGNYAVLHAGQYLFIDSGPDLGAYTITEIVQQDWGSTPPAVKVRVEKALTHTTENFPATLELDFASLVKAVLLTGTITFPTSGLSGLTLSIGVSTDSGATFPTTKTHVWSASVFADVAALVADINSVATLTAGGVLEAFDGGNGQLGIRTVATPGPTSALRVNSASAATIAAGIAYVSSQSSRGARGAVTLAGTKRIYGSGLDIFSLDDYLTVFAAQGTTIATIVDDVLNLGDDAPYLGTFKVVALGVETEGEQTGQNFVELDRSENFPASTRSQVRWVRLPEAPDTTPANTSGGGKEISSQFVRFRLYDNVSKRRTIEAIPWSAGTHPLLATSETQATLAAPGIIDTGNGETNFGHMDPYRILRDGVLRVSATSMAKNREGALYYIDVPVIGYGPGPEMNIEPSEGFVLAGNYSVEGYTLRVDDENFVFSSKEQVSLILPNAVLPVGSTPELPNKFNLAGQNLQVTYNNAPLIDDVQRFIESPDDRVVVANMLARHFLPAYVLLDVEYAGGASEDVVAADIIDYINNIDPASTEIRTDTVQDVMKKRGATTVELPITVIALVHGTDRRIRGMRSETAIGVTDLPLFKGTFKQTYFIAGPDTSKLATRPDGEQVYLKRS